MIPRAPSICAAIAPAILVSSVGLSACGPRFDAEADVRDHEVQVHVRNLKPGDEVQVAGFEGAGETAKYGHTSIEIPAERVGAGKRELSIEVTRGEKTKIKKISVDVPASALEPYLSISGCTGFEKGQYGDGAVKLKSKAMRSGAAEQRCRLQPNAGVELTLRANADAEVKLGDHVAQLTGGAGTGVLSVQPVLHELSLGGASNSNASGELPLEVQATSSRGGNTRTFAIELQVALKAIRSALLASVLEMDGGKAASWPRSAHSGKPRAVVFAAKRHPVQVDGRSIGTTPVSFTVRHAALRIFR